MEPTTLLSRQTPNPSFAGGRQHTNSPLAAYATDAVVSDREWIRLPRSGDRCAVCGLSRSTLNKLILPNEQNAHQPPVRSVVLKQRWAIRGIRLINRQSLTNYLDSLDDTKAKSNAEEGR